MPNESRRVLATLGVLGLLLSGCRGTMLDLVGRQAETAMRADLPAELQDGLHVLLCGAGGPLPDPRRSGPCVAIIAGETVVLIDAGSNVARNLPGRGQLGPAGA